MSCVKDENHYDDEALSSPYGKISLEPQTEQILHCAMGLKHPIDVDAIKKAFSDSVMIQHPRFCSLVIRDRGRIYWRKSHVNIDDHFIIIDSSTAAGSSHVEDDDVEASVNAYLAELAASSRLSDNKPLWDVHVLLGLNCIVLRVHHCICDAACLMSMLSACFGKQRDGTEGTENGVKMNKDEGKTKWMKGGVWGWVKSICLTCAFIGQAIGKISCVKADQTVISGGDGVELWPRKLETLKCELQDFKSIKKVIPNATVNDVLLGIISFGLTKYLRAKSLDAPHHQFKVTAVIPVNLRKGPGLQELSELMRPNGWSRGSSAWGNKTSIFLLPIHSYNELHPLEHVKKMKAIMDQRKQSYVPQFMYYMLPPIINSCFGLKAATWMIHRGACNTTLTISNIVGPSEEIAIASNPITYMRINICSLPQGLMIYMVSYAGKTDLQVMVAKDVIPDSLFLVKCLRESLVEMKGCIDGGKQ